MKKIIASIAAGLLLIAPAFADEDAPDKAPDSKEIVGNAPAEFAFMISCAATRLSLMHLRLQVAASITALSAPDLPPQLAALVTSYRDLADADHKQIESYVDTVRKVIIPEIIAATSMKEGDLLEKAQQMTNQTLSQIAMVVSDPQQSFGNQTQLERLLMQQSDACETLAQKIIQRNTL
jgi:hypothetical protein